MAESPVAEHPLPSNGTSAIAHDDDAPPPIPSEDAGLLDHDDAEAPLPAPKEAVVNAAAPDLALAKAVDNVLYSDVSFTESLRLFSS
jgi:hypothetical protein